VIFRNKLFSFFFETRVEDPDPHYFGKQDPDRDPNPAFEYKSGSGLGSTLKSKFRSSRGSKKSHGGPWTLTMEAWRLKIEPWRVHEVQWSQICMALIRSRIRIPSAFKLKINSGSALM
jgi:hypothetical protein